LAISIPVIRISDATLDKFTVESEEPFPFKDDIVLDQLVMVPMVDTKDSILLTFFSIVVLLCIAPYSLAKSPPTKSGSIIVILCGVTTVKI